MIKINLILQVVACRKKRGGQKRKYLIQLDTVNVSPKLCHKYKLSSKRKKELEFACLLTAYR